METNRTTLTVNEFVVRSSVVNTTSITTIRTTPTTSTATTDTNASVTTANTAYNTFISVYTPGHLQKLQKYTQQLKRNNKTRNMRINNIYTYI